MARYRSLETAFWQDNFTVKLPAAEKIFYIYILTNIRTNQCGIYNFSITFSAVELGCSEEEVKALINKFIDYGKILYDEETEEIMILNWYKYNLCINKNISICANKELSNIKNKEFIKRLYELCKNKNLQIEIIFNGIDVVKDLMLMEKPRETETKNTEIAEVVKHFSSNIHPITPIELQDIKDWCEKLNEEIVIKAINEAVRNNARNIKYINGILINWHSENLKTAEAVDAFMRNWKDKLNKRDKSAEEFQNINAYRVVGEVLNEQG